MLANECSVHIFVNPVFFTSLCIILGLLSHQGFETPLDSQYSWPLSSSLNSSTLMGFGEAIDRQLCAFSYWLLAESTRQLDESLRGQAHQRLEPGFAADHRVIPVLEDLWVWDESCHTFRSFSFRGLA